MSSKLKVGKTRESPYYSFDRSLELKYSPIVKLNFTETTYEGIVQKIMRKKLLTYIFNFRSTIFAVS